MMNFDKRVSRRRSLTLLLAATLVSGAGAGQAQTRITHAQGEITLASVPKTVLVFDLASLDTLQALGVEVRGVPTVKLPARLARFNGPRYIKIGSLFEPDLEAVRAAKPDLIIVGGRSAPKYAQLARIAPTIDLSVNAKDFLPSVYGNVLTLGKVFGKQEQARALVQNTRDSIVALNAVAAKSGNGLMVLTNGGKMSAYGPGSRFGVLHEGFGIAAAQPRLTQSSHGQAVSFEFVLQTNPDWLFVLDRDAAIGKEGGAARRLLDNELVRKTGAWRKNQVLYLDPANWYLMTNAGIGALRANVEQLSKALGAARIR